jgi:hypothetical protein
LKDLDSEDLEGERPHKGVLVDQATHKDGTMPEKVLETDAGQLDAFHKWLAHRETRKASTTVKRAAQKAFKAQYAEELEKLQKTVTVASKAKAPEVLTQAEKAEKWDALQGKRATRQDKSSRKRAAFAALQKAHKKEWDAAVAAATPKTGKGQIAL